MIDAFFLCFVGIMALIDTWHLGEKRFVFFRSFSYGLRVGAGFCEVLNRGMDVDRTWDRAYEL